MLKIALCDDKPEDLAGLRNLLAEYQRSRPVLELEVHPFSGASGVLDSSTAFDIFLLDILMPGLNGIELGRELSGRCPTSPILYLTTSRDFALASYRTRAMSYLLKPVGRAELFDALDRAVKQCGLVHAQAFSVSVNGGVRRVFYHELVSAETVGQSIEYHLPGELVTSITRQRNFTQLWAKLREDGRFLLIRRGMLVNMDHINLMGETSLKLSDGQVVPIPRQRRKEVRRAYLDYCRRWAGAEVEGR